MKIKVCEKCKHFTQHYIYSDRFGLSDVQCGHCHKKLMKEKDCGCFEENDETHEKEITIIQKVHLYNRRMNELSNKLETLIASIKSLENEVKNL